MKKFGTPSGAGPGDAKLNDGLLAVGTPPDDRGGVEVVLWCPEDDECEPEPEPECDEWPPEPCEEEPGLDPPLPRCEEEGGGFEWPPPELFGGGFMGGGDELVRVFVVVVVGGVVVVVDVVTLGHVSLILDTRGGSFRVEGDTPGRRW